MERHWFAFEDVVASLPPGVKADFCDLHYDLDDRKRRGEIGSVSYELFRLGPKLTGLQVWRDALRRHVKHVTPPPSPGRG